MYNYDVVNGCCRDLFVSFDIDFSKQNVEFVLLNVALLIWKPDKVVFNLRLGTEGTPNTNKYLTKLSDETTSFDQTEGDHL